MNTQELFHSQSCKKVKIEEQGQQKKAIKMIKLLKDWKLDLTNINDYTESEQYNLSLKEYTKDMPQQQELLKENQLISIIKQILRGLKVLHSHRIIHGNLIPKNILMKQEMIGDNIQIKITNFGFAKRHKFRGTPGYIDPEFEKDFKKDIKCEIKQLGQCINQLYLDNEINSEILPNIIKQLQEGIDKDTILQQLENKMHNQISYQKQYQTDDKKQKESNAYSQSPSFNNDEGSNCFKEASSINNKYPNSDNIQQGNLYQFQNDQQIQDHLQENNQNLHQQFLDSINDAKNKLTKGDAINESYVMKIIKLIENIFKKAPSNK